MPTPRKVLILINHLPATLIKLTFKGNRLHEELPLTNTKHALGKKQEFETLISEEALLLAKYLKPKKKEWILRLLKLNV